MRFTLRSASVAVLLAWAAPLAAKPLELSTAIATALRHNPVISSAEAATRGARAQIGLARVRSLPQFAFDQTLTRSFIHANAPTPQITGGVAGIPIVQYTTLERSNFALSQLITDFGRTQLGVHAARHALRASKYAEFASRAQLVADVSLAFTAVNLGVHLADAARAAARIRAESLSEIEEGLEEGIRARYDVARARLDQQSAQLAVVSADADLAASRIALEAVLGVSEGTVGPLRDNLDAPLIAPASARLVPDALARRPEVLAAAADLRRAETTLRAARTGYYPRVSSTGNYAHNDGTFGPGDSWALGVVAEVPLFDGLQTRYDIRAARAAVDVARAALRTEELAVIRDVKSAAVQLESAKARMVEASLLDTRARDNLQLAHQRYKEGIGNIIEVSDAQLNVTLAYQAVARAKADQQAASIRLTRAAHLFPRTYFPAHPSKEPAR